jgi:mono/diheme cytochrome c family protein
VSLARNTARPLLAALAAAAVALPLGACGRNEPDLTKGKALFTANCGSCHVLARAGTQGQTGPNLDAAFRAALDKGISRDTVEGVVHRQILHPNTQGVMPAGIVRARTPARWPRPAWRGRPRASRSSPPPGVPAATRCPRRAPPATSARA